MLLYLYTSEEGCPHFQYHCPNGKCIPSDWQCDGIKDCDENAEQSADEIGCPAKGKDYFPFSVCVCAGVCVCVCVRERERERERE